MPLSGTPRTVTFSPSISRSCTEASSSFAAISSVWLRAFSAACITATPTVYVVLLPALRPVIGATSVSPVVIFTLSMSTPYAVAAICASAMLVPAMSTWPVNTCKRAVGVEPHGGAGRLKTAQPAAERDARPSKLSVLRARLPLGALLPDRVLREAGQHLGGAVAQPRLVVGHLVAFALQMAQAELDRVDAERLRDLLHVGVDREDRLGRDRRAVGGDARLVREDLEALDVEVRPQVEARQEDAGHGQHGAGVRAGFENRLGLQSPSACRHASRRSSS